MNGFTDSARIARACAAEKSYGDPSQYLRIVGITGTNGKTTTAHLVGAILERAHIHTHVLGTINSPLTTLGEPELAQTLARLHKEHVVAVAMEVSSHGLAQHRVDGIRFEVTAFSNLTQDHLDYHHDMDTYFAAKKRLFLDLESPASVINIAHHAGCVLAAEVASQHPCRNLVSVGTSDARVYAENIRRSVLGTTFDLVMDARFHKVAFPLVGRHNVDNALLAAGCAYGLGLDTATIAAGLEQAPQVAGRLQRLETDGSFNVFIDYAHTPDALEHALGALRTITPGRLIVVFGCGGDRDRGKRPLMGAVGAEMADRMILTTDNPRSESPDAIIKDIYRGIDPSLVSKCNIEVDRQQAIACAIDEAVCGDSILIAGKGHETYQIFADKTIDFDDACVAYDLLRTHRGVRRQESEVK